MQNDVRAGRSGRDASAPAIPAAPDGAGARPKGGSPLAGVAGLLLGGAIGLAIGFVAFVTAQILVLPEDFAESPRAMWAIILGVAAFAALVGLREGLVPTRAGRAVLAALAGFFLTTLAISTLAFALAFFHADQVGPALRGEQGPFHLVFTLLLPVLAWAASMWMALRLGRRAWRRFGGGR